ncbi:MAG TPA: DUF308 domain-containing protein [Ideonella sp.]|nr:DUF308 domain-containing protein [Ideonella sp.]
MPRASGWSIAWGALLILAGVLAVLMPAVAALATVVVFAWLLIFSGAVEVGYAVQRARVHAAFGWALAVGVVTLLLGIATLVLPLAGVVSLALLVGAFLFAGGIGRLVLAFKLRPLRGWGWVLLDGALSIVVAVLIAIGWPASSIAVIGVLTGLWLIFAGVWRLMLHT